MRKLFLRTLSVFALAWATSTQAEPFADFARAHRDALLLSTYVTVETAHQMATDPAVQADSLRALDAVGISKIYFETARGCPALPREEMIALRDFYTAHGYAVAAGLATHPSQPGFGTRADRGLAWFNYQSPATQQALDQNVRDSAAVFDELILDDFFCSGDESPESDAVRRGREWGTYRRDLLTGLAQSHVITPAKQVNPNCTVIIKFPQWYDLFDRYGYDPEREPQLFDRVFVGTEARGPHTQRFGFTQPSEGFNNFRWLAACSGKKIGGAWFDFVDSNPEEYVDHAWMSVLAGARELVLFSFPSLLKPDPGLDTLRRDFPKLVKLAAAVAESPPVGVMAYKPPNSPAGNDIYLFDHLAMLGIPLVPTPSFPADSSVSLLPTQAAADTNLLKKLTLAIKPGKTFVFTPGLLATAPDGEALSRLAGVQWPRELTPLNASHVRLPEDDLPVPRTLDLATRLKPVAARVVLSAVVQGELVPLLTELEKDYCRFLVLNVRAYGAADFLATGEYLLSPRDLGLADLPQPVCNILRRSIAGVYVGDADLPSRATIHSLGDAGWLVQNFRENPMTLTLTSPVAQFDRFKLHEIKTDKNRLLTVEIAPHSEIWLAPISSKE